MACAVAALMPGAFRWDAWLFGVGLGLAQSLVGLQFYRKALSRPSPAISSAIGSGLARIVAMLAALAAVMCAGASPAPFIWSLLVVYAVMMAAEVLVVARWTGATAKEAS